MLTKEITYTDFDGVERTETFYFNLTKTEISEMELLHPGGYSDYLERLIKAKEVSEMTSIFKTLILNSYGEKSEDGKHFRKSEEISRDFSQTAAYDVLFMEMLTDPDAASNFVNGIMPVVDLTEEQREELNERTRNLIESKKSESA